MATKEEPSLGENELIEITSDWERNLLELLDRLRIKTVGLIMYLNMRGIKTLEDFYNEKPDNMQRFLSPVQFEKLKNNSTNNMDRSLEAILHSIRPDSFVVVDSETHNPIGDVHEQGGAYFMKRFETGGLKENIIKQQTKIQKYDLETSSGCKGLGLIFAVKLFNNGHVRHGAVEDVSNLENLFLKMHLKVIKFLNPSREKIMSEIANQVAIHLESPSFFIAISSHGKEGNQIICADNKLVSVAEILALFQIPQLLGKPKVFIIEACRGDKHDSIILTDNYFPDKINTYPAATKESDILVAYACVPGYVAYREPNKGSWFITSLCQAYDLLEDERVDFYGILTYANHIMLQKNYGKEENINKQPMHLESTLSKLLII